MKTMSRRRFWLRFVNPVVRHSANDSTTAVVAAGHRVARQMAVVVRYEGVELTTQRLDMIVDGKCVVEIKSTQLLAPFASRQLYNYLRATSLDVGLLLHFGPRPSFSRIVCESAPVVEPSANKKT